MGIEEGTCWDEHWVLYGNQFDNKFHINFFSVYSFLKENASRGGAENERDTESEAGSRLWAVSTEPSTGLEPTNHEIVTWAEVGRLTNWATQVPHYTGVVYPTQYDMILQPFCALFLIVHLSSELPFHFSLLSVSLPPVTTLLFSCFLFPSTFI